MPIDARLHFYENFPHSFTFAHYSKFATADIGRSIGEFFQSIMNEELTDMGIREKLIADFNSSEKIRFLADVFDVACGAMENELGFNLFDGRPITNALVADNGVETTFGAEDPYENENENKNEDDDEEDDDAEDAEDDANDYYDHVADDELDDDDDYDDDKTEPVFGAADNIPFSPVNDLFGADGMNNKFGA